MGILLAKVHLSQKDMNISLRLTDLVKDKGILIADYEISTCYRIGQFHSYAPSVVKF
jgi:hypothetical protein